MRSALLLVTGLLAACAGGPPRHEPMPATAERVVQTALAQVGSPYRYGGFSPDGFDCSGLVHYSYAHAGVFLPRSTEAQLQVAREIAQDELRPGDLLFFRLNHKPVSHVAVYIGDGRFVHAPSRGKRVQVERLSQPYWRDRLVHGGRITALWEP